jgi:hypothetical protein
MFICFQICEDCVVHAALCRQVRYVIRITYVSVLCACTQVRSLECYMVYLTIGSSGLLDFVHRQVF